MFALVDCNNFYASCERAFNPKLEGKPIVVLSNNDGCIIARSNEAKKLGIPMGAPFFKWKKLCSENKVHVFSSNYELYGDMSARVMKILISHSSDIEIYSIDEAFLAVDGFSETSLIEYATQLRKNIKLGTGLPVSIGIGLTKTLSKIANYIAKTQTSTGVYHLTNANLSILKEFPVEKIWGVGSQLSAKLNKLRLYTAQDLMKADPKKLRQLFSVNMEKIIYELRGVSCLALDSIQPRKQIISSRSFGKSVTAISEIEEAVSHYAAIASEKLRKQKSLAAGVSVFLHTNLFSDTARRYANSTYIPFPAPTANTGYIIQIAKRCLKHIYREGYHYQKVGLMLVDLAPNSIRQFDWLTEESELSEALMKTVDSINHIYGKDTIYHCAEGIARPWQIKSAKKSPCYTTRWKDILKCK